MATRGSDDYMLRDTSQDSQTSDAESSSTPLPFLPPAHMGSLNRELVDKKNKYQVRFQVNHENVTDEELAAMSESLTQGRWRRTCRRRASTRRPSTCSR